MRAAKSSDATGVRLKIVQTYSGPVAMTCATCAHSEFVRGNLHACLLADGESRDEDDGCDRWRPLTVGVDQFVFGSPAGEEDVVL